MVAMAREPLTVVLATLPLSTLWRLSTARPRPLWRGSLLASASITGLLVRRPQSVTASAPCWGEKEFIFIFSGKQFKWTLLLADVKLPILGVDFLWHYNLLVVPTANKLLSVAATAHSPPAHVAVVSTPSATMGTHHTTSLVPPGSAAAASEAAISSPTSLCCCCRLGGC
jgi:hypothetical protein